MKNGRKIAGWVVTLLAVAVPALGVVGKITEGHGISLNMIDRGFADWLTIIAIGEAIAVITFIIPRTFKLGLLLMTALMGGAIAVEMGFIALADNVDLVGDGAGEPYLQVAILVLVWVAALIRDPKLLKA